MISFAGSSSASILAQPTVSPAKTPASAPTDDDSSASFSDVMQQHEDSSASGQPETTPAAPTAAAKPTAPAPIMAAVATPTKAAAPAKASATPVAPGSGLSAMLIQASVLASNSPTTPIAKVSTPSPSETTATTADETDLAKLLAQATALLSGGKVTVATIEGTPTTSSTPASANKTAKDSGTTTASVKGSNTTTSSPIDLSTLIAQSTLFTPISTASAGKDLPISGPSAGAVGSLTKEKKSGSASAGGSFLQSGTASTATISGASELMAELQGMLSGTTANQQLTPSAAAKNPAPESMVTAASSLAGTANVEKGKAMNSDLNYPELQLLSGNGASAVPAPSADLHIQLASNHDFTDALTQVMHVAKVAEFSGSRAPLRVEMEIQTPPGAIVNVYVSKQNDQWRAQLSTNDPAALSWVQDQVSSLRQSGDLGVEVKWLPPQLEGTGTIATSGSQESNLSWNQGGQGQAGYEQPDERQRSTRQQDADTTPELVAATQFSDTLSALGRAA